MNKFRAYIHRHVFLPSQDSSVWFVLTSREQLMLPECSKHQVGSFAKMLVVWCVNKQYSALINVRKTLKFVEQYIDIPTDDKAIIKHG